MKRFAWFAVCVIPRFVARWLMLRGEYQARFPRWLPYLMGRALGFNGPIYGQEPRRPRLPGPATRMFELELAMHPGDPETDHDETMRVSFETETIRVNASIQDVLIEECRRSSNKASRHPTPGMAIRAKGRR